MSARRLGQEAPTPDGRGGGPVPEGSGPLDPAGARILERGYRRYDGPRQGEAKAVRALARHALERVLGLRRPAWSKLLPAASVVTAYLPAAVFVGLVAVLPRSADFVVPSYGDYYAFVTAAIALFVVLVAPEALCPDRRSRLLSLYLASPLTRTSYVVGKALAVGAVLALVTLGPPLLLLVGLALQGAGPDGLGGFALVVVRIVASGALLSAFYTALSMAVSSCTDRRAFASAATLLLIVGSAAVTGILVYGLEGPDWLLLFNLNYVPYDAVRRVHGELGLGPPFLPTTAVLGAVLAWTLAAGAFTWWRYQRAS